MIVRYHKRFEKQFGKLSQKDKQKVMIAVDKFIANPFDKSLSSHQLKGALKDMRAFSAAPDLRVVFEEFDNYVLVVFLDLGKHDRVYK